MNGKAAKNKLDRSHDMRMMSPVVMRHTGKDLGASKQKFNFESQSKAVENRFRSMIKTSRDVKQQRDFSLISSDSKQSGTNVSYQSNFSNIKNNIMRFKYKGKLGLKDKLPENGSAEKGLASFRERHNFSTQAKTSANPSFTPLVKGSGNLGATFEDKRQYTGSLKKKYGQKAHQNTQKSAVNPFSITGYSDIRRERGRNQSVGARHQQ